MECAKGIENRNAYACKMQSRQPQVENHRESTTGAKIPIIEHHEPEIERGRIA